MADVGSISAIVEFDDLWGQLSFVILQGFTITWFAKRSH
jgi:hypothetical protein